MRDDAGAYEAELGWDDDAPVWRAVTRHHGTTKRGRVLRLRPAAFLAVLTVMGAFLSLVFVDTPFVAAAPNIGCSSASTVPGSLCVMSSANGPSTDPVNAPYNTGVVKGEEIGTFKWLVNDDSTGDPSLTQQNVAACLPDKARPTDAELATNPSLAIYRYAGQTTADANVPADKTWNLHYTNCPWPSTHSSLGHSDVIATGDQGQTDALNALGDGKYLLSVTAPGYKIDGVHFTVLGHVIVSVNDIAGKPFVVTMNPLPKKTATVRIHVYNDNASTNGQWDGQTESLITCADATTQQRIANCGGANNADPNLVGDPETDMSGFTVQITDVLNPVTTDVYGNPLCTQYVEDANHNVVLNGDGSPIPVMFADGGATGGSLVGTESTCISDHFGDIVIPNMGPNRYAATVIPPDPRTHDGEQWVQTTTLEGGHDWDTWNIEGGTGYDTELIVGGERVTPVAHGFVKLTHNDTVWKAAEAGGPNTPAEKAYYDASPYFSGGSAGHGELKGRIRIGRAYIGSGGNTGQPGNISVPLAGTNLANAKEDGPIEDGLISVNCIAGCNAPTDQAVWVGRARAADGSFDITGLQTGDYTVAFWDESQNYILAVLSYHVQGDGVANNAAVTAASKPAAAPKGSIVCSSAQFARCPSLTFNTNPGLAVGDSVFLGGGAAADWNGEFSVMRVSNNGKTVAVNKVNAINPALDATVLPQPIAPPATDASDILLPGWFTDLQGSVFNDLNGDGIRQPDEPGIPDFTLTVRTRGNSLQDQGAAVAKTNDAGEYDLSQGYPLGQFLIFEAYNPRFKTTGITYSTDNDGHYDANHKFIPNEHTFLTKQVDFNFLPIIGLSAKIDVGVQAYGTGLPYASSADFALCDPQTGTNPASPLCTAAPKTENGGIVGTVTYDVTRNEFDPAYSVQEDYQPGISGIPTQLWKPHLDAKGKPTTYASGSGAAEQYGTTSGGQECLRPEKYRDTDAITDPLQDCKPFAYYVSESWTRPTGCTALDVNGNKLKGELVLPDSTVSDPSHSDPANPDCMETPMNGFQIGGDGSVDGNFALSGLIHPDALALAGNDPSKLADAYGDPASSDPLPNASYLVEAVNPIDKVNTATNPDPTEGGLVDGNTKQHLYRFTDESAVNIMSGDSYVPQGGYTSVGGDPTANGDYSLVKSPKNMRHDSNSIGNGVVGKCMGALHTVDDTAATANPDLAANGGNPYNGQKTPICDAKLVTVVGGRSVNPGFFMYTDVPVPSKFYGLMNDDLNVNVDRRSLLLGEVAPVSNGPVGIYDENGNWKYTAHTDVNGFYEVLVPSMDTYNCPLPAGPCPNMYRLVGNDPGTLDHRNLDYNPAFRTIATEFQAWTGVVHPVDQAPTHQGITIEGPAAQFGALSLCKVNTPDTAVDKTTPVFFSIDRPFYDSTDATHTSYTVNGVGFGTAPTVTLTRLTNAGVPSTTPSDAHPVLVTTPSDTSLSFTFGAGNVAPAPGAYQLTVTNTVSHLSTVNGLTFHVLGSGYLQRSDVYEVSPTAQTDNVGARTYTPQMDAWDPATDTAAGFAGTSKYGDTVTGGRAIQRAIEAAYNASRLQRNPQKLVVVYPNTAPNYAPHNAFAAYFENVVLHSNVRIQGVGPGSTNYTNNLVNGTNIDASQFWSATQVVPFGGNQQTADGSYSDDWRTFANALNNAGTTTELPEGEGVLAIAESPTQYNNSGRAFKPGVDGVLITGGDQQGNPGNVNTAPGAVLDGTAAPTPPGPAQGGAITLDQYVNGFAISNNLIQSNGGTYGTIRIGTPDMPSTGDGLFSNNNQDLVVLNNRIVANGGTNLAGALGIFQGADRYTVSGNDFCGNFSAEYGGAISHYGSSPGGKILHNRIYYNQGYDEGGGVFIAGELPANTSQWVAGAGSVGSPTSGSTADRNGVTVDGNLILANQSNDDGGGLRFLMAGDFPMLVQNNIIANNVSTHEGGGVALDDTSNVTLVNNTIVKNITTATAATNAALSDGVKPQNPAGLSTAANGAVFQAHLPQGAANWSKPKLMNNIFLDNRAGWAQLPTSTLFNQSAIHGIGEAGDSAPIQRWDVGIAGGTSGLHNDNTGLFSWDGVNNTTNTLSTSTLNTDANSHTVGTAFAYEGDLNTAPNLDGTSGYGFKNPVDFVVDSLMWRNNTNVSFPTIVALMVPVNLLADYHISDGSPAVDHGVVQGSFTLPTASVQAPTNDIDNDPRPITDPIDRGADQLVGLADLSITKTGTTGVVSPGGAVTFTVTATNNGPSDTRATVTDTMPSSVAAGSWTCTASTGSSCPATINSKNLTAANAIATLKNGGTATYVFTGTVQPGFLGTISNSASVVPASGSGNSDPNLGNNGATATVTVAVTGNVSVAVSGPGAIVHRGQNLPYVITITNNGTTTMQEHFSSSHTGTWAGTTLYSCTASSGGNCGGATLAGDISNRIVTVAGSGGTVTFTYSVTIPFLGTFNTVSVPTTAANGATLSVTGTLVADVPGYIDTNGGKTSTLTSTVQPLHTNLVLGASNTASSPQTGANYAYSVTLTNNGVGVEAIGGVQLAIPQPTDVSMVSWSCVAQNGSSCNNNGGIFSPPGTSGTTWGGLSNKAVAVGAGGSITITITARRSGATIHGLRTLTATATIPTGSSDQAGPLTASTGVTFS